MNDVTSIPGLPPAALAEDAVALVRRLARLAAWLAAALAAALAASLAAGLTGLPASPALAPAGSALPPLGPIAAELLRGGAIAVPLAALLLGWGALRATVCVARERLRAAYAPDAADRIGRAARLPQALWLPACGLPAAALAWWPRAAAAPPLAPAQTGYALGGVAIAVSFLLLIAERSLAAVPPRALPEAPGLRALAFLATLVCFAAGLNELAANLGVPLTGLAGALLALPLVATALELSARALGRLFLPPPAPAMARAAVASLLARLVAAGAAGAAEGGVAAPLRQHFGLDFSRSWALAYVRAASLPLLGALLLLAWGLSGTTLVPLDGRAVYERFGAPVQVLHPGLHVGLPWPLGTHRAVEYGTVHEIGLVGGVAAAALHVAAEDVPPPDVDRLWEQPHPGEVALLIASATLGRESFQSVSGDLRILYRVGLTDADALRAAYATAAPEALVRATAGQVVARYFADQTLDVVLGADREAMADTLRARVQARLDAAGSGLEAVAVVVEAIHPPAGAADAYHNVRAAQIAAEASVAVERGAAAAIAAQSRQYAFQQTANAVANGVADVEAARTLRLRFEADAQAAAAGGPSFLLERYFAALAAALGRVPKTIIDSRLSQPEAPVLDLRPIAGAAGIGAVKED